MTLCTQLWRGDVPLVKTFWLGFILSRALMGVAVYFIALKAPGMPTWIAAGVFLAVTLFLMVAVWRSALRYFRQNSGRKRRFLAGLAMLFVILTLIGHVAPLARYAQLRNQVPVPEGKVMLHMEE